MGKIDKEKEEISWIKFWIGVSVAAMMGLISWFVNNFEKANNIILGVDIFSIVILAFFIIILNKVGLQKIKKLEEL